MRHEVKRGDAAKLLARVASESVDLAYIDPPFGTGLVRRARHRHTGATSEFRDRWGGLDDYLDWLRTLLVPAVESLRPTGALFVHCDWRASHHVRVLLDSVLGPANFRNEIIWHYRRWTAARSSLQRLHQTIYYYARSNAHKPSIPRVDYSPTTNLDQIWQTRSRNKNQVTTYAMDGQTPRNNGAKQGVPLGDVWEIPPLNPKARERVGYPTQKPLVLLERILTIASQPGDVVLDPCCGSGTTLVAAQLLGRQSIGFDISSKAVELTRARLASPIRSPSRILGGRQEFERRWKSADYRLTLELLHAHAVHRNKYLHGYLSPTGLEKLDLPASWSVPVALVESPPGGLEDWILHLNDIVVEKACDVALVLVSPWDKAPPATRQSDRIVTAPWPRTDLDVDSVRRCVQTWFATAQQESSRAAVVAGRHPNGS
jgi:site-specific DNA-methyltransferase (adenine-specific)